MRYNVSNIVYGGIDGTVTTFAVMAGAFGTNLTGSTVVILALASLFGDGFSMGVSSYESVVLEEENALLKGVTTFASFVLIGALPILIYYYYRDADSTTRLYVTVVAVLLTLFLIGMFKNYSTSEVFDPSQVLGSGAKTMGLGAAAGAISYYVATYLARQIK